MVDAERCVHGRSPIAQCNACVEACPRAAFALENEGLTFDDGLCDGCALCAPACPEQAIEVGQATHSLLSLVPGAERAYLACEKVITHGGPGVITCLHAVSVAQLASLHSRGIRILVTAAADCGSCSRLYGPTLGERISHLTRLTRDRGLAPLMQRNVDAAAWCEERGEVGQVTRRSLFRAAFGSPPTSPSSTEKKPAAAENGVATPDHWLDARDRATIATFSPLIDHAACVACGACVEACEHDALRLADRDSDTVCYVIDATRCTGCALCADNCAPGAIAVLEWGPAHPPPVPLVWGKCRVCSSPFLAVAGAEVDTSLCHICATKTHHQKLFQVLP